QDALALDDLVKDYLERKRPALPEGIETTPWGEYTKYIRDRIDLLLKNGAIGLCLVVLALWIFLNIRLAFWVALGIPISFAGGLTIMFLTGQSINMISLFALIMATGLIVDDAIIIGENAYAFMKRGHSPRRSAVIGTLQVLVPVFATVATTCVAFAPLLVVPGVFGKFMRVIPLALIATLSASLIEAFFILPAHLSHTRSALFCQRRHTWMCRRRARTDALIEWFIHRVYEPFFRGVLRFRLTAFVLAFAVLLLCLGLQVGGFIKFIPFPDVDSDIVQVQVNFPYGTPPAVTEGAVRRIEAAAEKLNRHYAEKLDGQPIINNMASSIGVSLLRRGDESGAGGGPQTGSMIVELAPAEIRGSITSTEVLDKWRDLVGTITGADSVSFSSARGGPGSADLQVRLRGGDLDQLADAAKWLEDCLATFEGVEDIEDDFVLGPPETQASRLTPEGESLGLTIRDVGLQLRYGFDGAEAFRIQRGRDEVKVKIRYPEAMRKSLGDVESIRIRTPGGDAVPVGRVAHLEPARDPAVIRRQDRSRVVNVLADVDSKTVTADEVMRKLGTTTLREMMNRFPGVTYSFEGTQQETGEALGSLAFTFPLAIMVIYLILAAQFGSYIQPVIIMITIPFGIVGAVLGHYVMDIPLTILSIFGIVALTGVVVNDALVLIEFINIGIREGKTIWEAVAGAGPARFRAITLTSTTTVAGLLPIILERSMQARFLVPMAVAISGGLIVATFLNLLITPAIYLMINDIRRFIHWLVKGDWPTREAVEPIVGQIEETRHDREVDQQTPDETPLPEDS
ncbi:MAG: efflux RND transporter permease subunit, partial [Planctomycetota bacterium]